MTEVVAVLGVDVSKRTLDVCLLHHGKRKALKVTNDETGFSKLVEWLKAQDALSAHVCMEATGKYFGALAEYFYRRGNVVSVVNPFRIKSFARSELKRSKTDKLDALIIAQFCVAFRPAPWTPLPSEIQELQEVERYLEALKTTRVQELNRISAGVSSAVVRQAVEGHVAAINTEISRLESWMRTHMKSHPKLREEHALITSVVGAGDMLASVWLGELGYVDRFKCSRQVEAFCGLSTRKNQSGTSLNGREQISKVGNKRLRKALYMPALAAMQTNPALREFASRLRGKGKSGKVVVCAIMRKLIRIIFALLKSRQRFDIAYQTT